MLIKVIKIEEGKIVFWSEYGVAFGVWKGEREPQIREYSVELDYNGVISNTQISVNNRKCIGICANDGRICISGKVDEIENGYLSIELGNCHMCFETEYDIHCKYSIGDYLTITIESLNLYDDCVD